MIKNWVLYILALLGGMLFFTFYQMWFAWYCLIILLLIPPLALLMCLLSGRSKRVRLTAPRNVKIGDHATITMDMGKSGISMFSVIRIRYSVTEKMTDHVTKRKINIHGDRLVKIPVDTSHCGAFRFDIEKVKIYDLFGLFWKRKKAKSSCEVVIQPVPQMPDVMPDMNGFKAKNLRKTQSPYSEIYDVRDYLLGDPIKNIHWKASAKKDTLLVKEPQEECFGHARVFLELEYDRDIFDRNMGELIFTSEYFLKKEMPHKIRVLPPRRREIAFEIQSQRDLDLAVMRILNMKIPKEADDEKK